MEGTVGGGWVGGRPRSGDLLAALHWSLSGRYMVHCCTVIGSVIQPNEHHPMQCNEPRGVVLLPPPTPQGVCPLLPPPPGPTRPPAPGRQVVLLPEVTSTVRSLTASVSAKVGRGPACLPACLCEWRGSRSVTHCSRDAAHCHRLRGPPGRGRACHMRRVRAAARTLLQRSCQPSSLFQPCDVVHLHMHT